MTDGVTQADRDAAKNWSTSNDGTLLSLSVAMARHRQASIAQHEGGRNGRVQKYLSDEAAARERLKTFTPEIRQRLEAWQEGQSEWFSDTLLEIVSEFIAFDDAHAKEASDAK